MTKIGIFDSGVGGLTVMREIVRLLPEETIVYLGDTARVPYGSRSPEAIQEYTKQGLQFLLKQEIELLVIACHTACSHSLNTLEIISPIPVIGVVQSGLEELLKATKTNRVAILGTTSTIRSGLYQNLIEKRSPEIKSFPLACPLFVPLIEEGFLEHPATEAIVKEYLAPLQNQDIDAALLACTHYPLIRQAIQKELGPHVQLIEPAFALAREIANQCNFNPTSEKKGRLSFFATDDPEKFATMAKRFFGEEVLKVSHATL